MTGKYLSFLSILSISLGFSTALSSHSLAHENAAAATTPASSSSLLDRDNVSSDLETFLIKGTPYLDARYRYEFVDQDNFSKDAKASTLRTRLGYKTQQVRGFTGVLEFENISAIGNEMYNDGGSTPSNASFPTVADPVGTELNQFFLEYQGVPETSVKYGRQTINRGNERFIGSVGWRQNDQNFDGVSISNKSLPNTEIFYNYSYNVNRVFGKDDLQGDYSGNVHMVDATIAAASFLTVMPYMYLIDVDTPIAQRGDSSNTYGINLSGSRMVAKDLKVLYYGEYARQSDAGDNPVSYDADYWRGELGLSYANVTVKGGDEELGSDNGLFAFRTPLATLHKFNGWADQFLVTPARGLQDIYGSAEYVIQNVNPAIDGLKLTAAYHDFSTDSGDMDYGNEWDFDISNNIGTHYSTGIQYADYNSDHNTTIGASADVQKVIVSLGVKF